MAMAGPMPTPTDTADLLQLSQWLSPAFPVSAYAYSHGLEAAIAAGDIASAADLAAWLEGVIRHGAGWSDAVLVAAAMAEDADLPALTELALALAPSAERQRETAEQGAAFARTTGAILGEDFPPEPLPVAIGRAALLLYSPVDLRCQLPCLRRRRCADHAPHSADRLQ